MNRCLAIALLAAASLSACAAEPQANAPAGTRPAAERTAATAAPGEKLIRDAIAKAVPGTQVDSVKPSPIPGFQEVAIGGRVVYVSNDGKYLFQGSLVKLENRENLTSASEAALRRVVLDAVGRDRRIIFSPPNPKYRVTVFTDIDCGYCRKLHSQIADYNREGISVEYLFFPRAGLSSESYTKAVNVWCADDPRQALTDAKLDKPVPRKTCANPVAKDYALGREVGVDGTPAIYAADGTQIGGYLSPEDMLARLERQAALATSAR